MKARRISKTDCGADMKYPTKVLSLKVAMFIALVVIKGEAHNKQYIQG